MTLFVRVMKLRVCRSARLLFPSHLVTVVFLPHYAFKYGGILNGLDRMWYELDRESERLLKEREDERRRDQSNAG